MTKCNIGEKHPRSTISDKTALEIKKAKKRGLKIREIAIIYGISESTIKNIITRYYKHLDCKVK